VRQKRFRADLFYRLKMFHVTLPPLRDRPGDVSLLAKHFLRQLAQERGYAVQGFTAAALRKLNLYRWPGNVRELRNLVEAAAATASHTILDARDIPLPETAIPPTGTDLRKRIEEAVASMEMDFAQAHLRACAGNISAAARHAGMDRRAFWQLLRKHGLNSFLPGSPSMQHSWQV
jgi:two-component system response regulator GlrR